MIRVGKFFAFLVFYVKEVIVANLQIAIAVLRPVCLRRDPAFLVISIEGLTDLQLLIVTNLITMTPGTLSFDVSKDRRTALIHLLLPGESPEEDRRSFEEGYVNRVREIF
ncbi:MAG: Na+/H+ antiporter subunit E [Verrucomicrobiota bacterium]